MDTIDISKFDKAVESLRQYCRYELVDDQNRDLLNQLYVDPFENNGILNICLKDNTTVLIGRKGTGKSTIFMRMQNELRASHEVLTCYIDVKSCFDKAKMNYATISYLSDSDPQRIESYSLQRKFIMDFITELISEIGKIHDSTWERIKSKLGFSTKAESAIDKLNEIKGRITNNSHLETIELETLHEIGLKKSSSTKQNKATNYSLQGAASFTAGIPSISINPSILSENQTQNTISDETNYTRIFARIFEISSIIDQIRKVLIEMNYKRLFLILDDYSEIDQSALKTFCNLIVNPLNNTSDNFIKLKISAYPGRVELGELDSQKIDIRYLDYYQLYLSDKRDDMEYTAINYTRRIIQKRLEIYTGHSFDFYFDTSKNSIDDYCRVIFQMTLNVIRHIGLILDYAKDISLNQFKRITILNLQDAAKRFYLDRIEPFFDESRAVQMAYGDRIKRFEHEELLRKLINRSKEIKSDIRTKKYEAVIFNKDRTNPYCSHFHISKEYEDIISTLELNFFLSKYNEMSNKAGKKVSVYALNYGLCLNENIRWGKPEGNDYRTYFIESPFNYNPEITKFLEETKTIICARCGHEYSVTELPVLMHHSMNCLECMSPRCIEVRSKYKDEYKAEIDAIQQKNNLLEAEQYRFMQLLVLKGGQVTATEMAQELDLTLPKIGWLTKKLDEDYYYLTKDRSRSPVTYKITDLGSSIVIKR